MSFPALYEHMSQVLRLNEAAKGMFPMRSPKGVVVHYTASDDLSSTVNYLLSKNLGYHLLIDQEGKLTQLVDFHHMTYHAGKSSWQGQSANLTFLGVAFLCWGDVKPHATEEETFVTWSGKKIHSSQVREDKGRYWHMATGAQVKALMDFLAWCVKKGINPDYIVGHDECALPPGRKIDPGGCLPQPMHKVRDTLRGASA